jgi:diguanylate cyclase (GGDEF)-like protein/PAS domain S-box-containing protein
MNMAITSLPPDDLVVLAAEELDYAIIITDPSGKVLYCNRAVRRMFGYSAQQMVGHRAEELLSREGFDAGVLQRVRDHMRRRALFEEEVPLITNTGETVWMSALVKPLYDDDGELAHCLLVLSDINDSKQIQRLQRDVLEAIAQDKPLADVMDLICRRVEQIAPDVVCSILAVDAEQRLRVLAAPSLPDNYNRAIDGVRIGPEQGSCGTAAYRNKPVLVEDIATDPLWDNFRQIGLPWGLRACWSSPITLADGVCRATFAFYYRQKRGPSVWHEHIVRACVSLCGIAIERAEASERITRLAYYDSLTGLPNRAMLRNAMARRFRKGENAPAALIFIDIDHFKDVNDTLGHPVGDSFLREIAGRIVETVRPSDIVARHGGDEFVVVLEGADAHNAQSVAEELLHRITRPVRIDGVSLPASASIGISLCPDNGIDSATLLRNADTAMYRAKADGRGTYRMFRPEMNHAAQDRLLLSSLLRDAITAAQFHLAYQPQVDARTGRLAGVEALIRWNHPALGLVPPSRFIHIAEETGLIETIGEIVLAEACAQLRRWDDMGLKVPQVAVNVSAIQFRNPALPALVTKYLMASGLRPARLTIEVTESIMMETSPATLANADALREMGVAISMDDFGTGYSSLSHLARLPVTEIKIDRSFMSGLEDNEAVQGLVTSVIRIGEALKLRVVAEGVETPQQRDFLEARGCDVLQGYLFSEAQTADGFVRWLEKHEPTKGVPGVRGAA